MRFGFSEVEVSLGIWETLTSIAFGVSLVILPLVIKAILLGLGV